MEAAQADRECVYSGMDAGGESGSVEETRLLSDSPLKDTHRQQLKHKPFIYITYSCKIYSASFKG